MLWGFTRGNEKAQDFRTVVQTLVENVMVSLHTVLSAALTPGLLLLAWGHTPTAHRLTP